MGKNILIIEDNEIIRENTAEILELAGYTVLTAQNGKEGIEKVQQNKPNLIICDIMMPVLDGYGVLHLLSKNQDTASIPFIFLTAKAERSDFRKGMEMGADDYLTKPFDDIELLNAVESRLRKNEILKKEFAKDINGLNDFFSTAREFGDLKKLSENKEAKNYKKKETVYTEGGFAKGVFFINKGKVKSFRTNDDGKEFITGIFNEGEFFGYLTLLEGAEYPDTATALEEAEIYLIPADDFFALITQNAEVTQKFIKILSGSLQEKEDQLIKLAYNSVRKRIAEALVSLYNKYHTGGDTQLSISLSREDLASMVGTSQETAIRTLSDFKDEELISIKGSTISILNLEKLSKLRN
jgi:CRP-like cAMP-binding protein/CheY-like chemotaxis protein